MPTSLPRRLTRVPVIAGVRLWNVPLLAEVYQRDMQRATERDPLIAFWYFSRWAILEAPIEMSEKLGAWPVGGICTANSITMRKRTPRVPASSTWPSAHRSSRSRTCGLMSICSRPTAFVANWGSIRKCTIASSSRPKSMMRLGKRTATYWISLIQYDDGRYDTAETWFSKRVLDEEQLSHWEPAARYNLARSLEHLGKGSSDGTLQDRRRSARAWQPNSPQIASKISRRTNPSSNARRVHVTGRLAMRSLSTRIVRRPSMRSTGKPRRRYREVIAVRMLAEGSTSQDFSSTSSSAAMRCASNAAIVSVVVRQSSGNRKVTLRRLLASVEGVERRRAWATSEKPTSASPPAIPRRVPMHGQSNH